MIVGCSDSFLLTNSPEVSIMKFIEEMNTNIDLNTNICKIISSNLSRNQIEGGPSLTSRVGVVCLSFGSLVSVFGKKGVPIGPCSSGFYIP